MANSSSSAVSVCCAFVVLAAVAAVARAEADEGASKAKTSDSVRGLRLEMSGDNGATWTARGTVTLTWGLAWRRRLGILAKLTSEAAGNDLHLDFDAVGDDSNATSPTSSSTNNKDLATVAPVDRETFFGASYLDSERILFRLRDVAGGAAGEEVARLATSPCALVRGFVPSSRTFAVIPERFSIAAVVVPITSTSARIEVTGLQLLPSVNAHHSSSARFAGATDKCDKEILKRFTTFGVASSVTSIMRFSHPAPNRTPKLAESFYMAPTTAQTDKKDPPAADGISADGVPQKGSGDDKAPVKDDRSFLERYWHYIVIFVIYTAISSYFNPQGKGGKDGGAAGGAAPAKRK